MTFWKKSFFVYFLIYLFILFFVFRSLFFNLSTNLLDWRDYPTINWMIFQNVSKITTLDFNNYFDTNAFYPNKYSLLFSDLLLPQAIIEIPFYLITKDVILSFNILFFITFILNYFATFIFWKQIFKKNFLAFFGSIFVIFSPFIHLEASHFPMLSFWPFFFSFYFVLKSQEKKGVKNLIFAGVFLAIQFLASAYLSFYLMLLILLFYLIEFIKSKNQRYLLLRNLTIIFVVFVAVNGYFIKSYIDTKKIYSINHDLRENISYSAHLTDYIFTTHIDSITHNLEIIEKWNSLNKNGLGGQASFPGFLLFILFIYSFLEIKKNQNKLFVRFDIDKEQLFFTGLLLCGFLFSLGPRLNFNGAYAHIPTPYALLLKVFPLAQEIRVVSRWYFIFIVAIIYFALRTIKKLQLRSAAKIIITAILIFFFLEYIPINITTHSEDYIDNHYLILKDLCSQKKLVLLEIPVTHLNAYPDIVGGLNYISKVQLASTYHQCYLINGYSSYDMPHLSILSNNLYQAIMNNNSQLLISLLKESKTDIVKFNDEKFPREVYSTFPTFLQKFTKEKSVKQVDDHMYEIKY